MNFLDHRAPGTVVALAAVAALAVGCDQLPTRQSSMAEAPGPAFAKPSCPGHPSCKDDGGGGDDGGSTGDATYLFPDETPDNGLEIAMADGADVWNDGGRWLDIGFVGGDGLPDFTVAYDGTKAAFDAGECVSSNTTATFSASTLSGFLTGSVASSDMISGGLTVDKKNDEGGSSTEHRVAVQFTTGTGEAVLVALTGQLGTPVTVMGSASQNPADVTFTGGTVRVRAKVSGSSSTDPVLDCPHRDAVHAIVQR